MMVPANTSDFLWDRYHRVRDVLEDDDFQAWIEATELIDEIDKNLAIFHNDKELVEATIDLLTVIDDEHRQNCAAVEERFPHIKFSGESLLLKSSSAIQLWRILRPPT